MVSSWETERRDTIRYGTALGDKPRVPALLAKLKSLNVPQPKTKLTNNPSRMINLQVCPTPS